MKMLFTPFVDELSHNDSELRHRMLNIMVMYNIPTTVVARDCKVALNSLTMFLKKEPTRKASLATKRKLAVWVEKFEKYEKEGHE